MVIDKDSLEILNEFPELTLLPDIQASIYISQESSSSVTIFHWEKYSL
jgi:hypothetical protein